MNAEHTPESPPPSPSPAPVGTEEVAEPNKLTPREELYCVTVVETGNRPFSYRRAYNVGPTTKPATVWKEAQRIEERPHVRKRIAELRDNAAANATVSKQRLIQFLWDRIMADRRSLINHVRRCCRNCHGINHQHQWKDEMEFAMALAATMDFNNVLPEDSPARKPLPTDEGGYGFDPHREPEPTCDSPECMGDGVGKMVVADLTQLSGDAALIYEGMDRYGVPILASVAADTDRLSKLLGWSVEKVDSTVRNATGGKELPADMYDIPSTVTPEEASRRYLSLVQS